jgi:hypothetical protein
VNTDLSVLIGHHRTGPACHRCPVMATFVGVEEAEVIMAFPGVVTNSWLIGTTAAQPGETRDLPGARYRERWGGRGAWLLNLDTSLLSSILAANIVLYVLTYFLKPGLSLPRVSRFTAALVGAAAGAFQGPADFGSDRGHVSPQLSDGAAGVCVRADDGVPGPGGCPDRRRRCWACTF